MNNTSFHRRNLHISAIIFVFGLFFETAFAQFSQPGGDKSLFQGVSGITLGGVVQQWNIEDSGSVLQQASPVTISVPIGERVLMTIANSGSVTTHDTSKVSGISDTRVSLSYVFPGEKLWLTAGGSIPTGKTKLSPSELSVTSLVSQTAFAFSVPTFGQGYSGNVALVYAGTITRRMVLGIGASYYFKGNYEPVQSSQKFDYNPGDEISLNLGYDFITYSKVARISFDITATYFLEDKLNGATIFHSGPRGIGLISYSLKDGDYNHHIQLRARYRLQNTYYRSTDTAKYKASTQLEGQYSLMYPLNNWLIGTGIGEIKYYTGDQIPFGTSVIETGAAQIVSLGGDFTFLFSDIVLPTLNLRYSFGTVRMDGKDKSVNGISLGLGLKISF